MQYILDHFKDAEMQQYFGIPDQEAFMTFKNKLAGSIDSRNPRSFCSFILADKQTGHTIGMCGFHTWYIHHYRAEIGYHIAEAYQGRGLMSEAMNTVVRYGFEAMQLHRIEAFVGKDNEPSLRLMNRFGFVREGLLREHYFTKGVFEDSVCFSLLQSDYILSVNRQTQHTTK